MTVNFDDLEPINPDLRDCVAEELARLPGSRVVKRKGRLRWAERAFAAQSTSARISKPFNP